MEGLTAHCEVSIFRLLIEDDHPSQIIAEVGMLANHFQA